MVVKATFDDISVDEAFTGYVIVNGDNLQASSTTVTLQSGNATTTQEIIVVPKRPTSLNITGDFRRNYQISETFNQTGMVATVVYNNNETRVLPFGTYTITGWDSTAVAENLPLTVRYAEDGVEVTATILVNIGKTSMRPSDFVHTLPGNGTFTYDAQSHGVAVQPKPGISSGSITVKYSGDGVAYTTQAPVSVGTYTVAVDVAANDIYNRVTALVIGSFSIVKAVPTIGDVYYDSSVKTIYTSSSSSDLITCLSRTDKTIPGTFSLAAGSTFDVAGSRSFSWTFTPNDTANYLTRTGTVTVNVVEDILQSIAVTGAPSKKNYVYGDTFDTTGLTVTASYLSGRRANVTAQAAPAYMQNNCFNVGETSVTLAYTDRGITETVIISGLTVAKAPYPESAHFQIGMMYVANGKADTYTYDLNQLFPTGIPAGFSMGAVTFEKVGNGYGYTGGLAGHDRLGSEFLVMGLNSQFLPTLIDGVLTFQTKSVMSTAEEYIGNITLNLVSANYQTQAVNIRVYSTNYTPILISGVSVNSKPYDGTALQYSGTPIAKDGAGNTVSVSGYDYTWYTADGALLGTAPKDAGIYYLIVSVNVADPNFVGTTTLSCSIGKRTLTVAADDKTIIQNGVLPAFSIKYTGFVGSDSESKDITVRAKAHTVTDGKTAGTFPIQFSSKATLSPTTAKNYDAVYQEGVLTVKPSSSNTGPDIGGNGGGSTGGGGGSIGTSASDDRNTIANPDGSVTIRQTDKKSGTVSEVTTYKDGTVLTVLIPTTGDTSMRLSLGKELKQTTVVIPVEKADETAVIMAFLGDGFKVLKDCVLADGGIKATFTQDCELKVVFNSKLYSDISPTDWYAEAINFVSSREIMSGDGTQVFAPQRQLSRAMLTQLLLNFNGGTAKDTSSRFLDVDDDAWYTVSVNWAVVNNLASGYGPDKFGPDDPITREQLAAILYRYARYMGYDVTAACDITAYTDAADVSDFAAEAMEWACGAGLIRGNAGSLNPKGNATRAEVAAIIQRLCEHVVTR